MGAARREGLDLPAQQAAALARCHKVPPALMTGAVQAVGMARGKAEEIDFVVGSLSQSFGRGEAPQLGLGRFDADLANADMDLDCLQRALAAPGAPRNVSLCFYGPPGTGKSAFARQLAEAMQLDPLVKRGSDLLSKWIGETERNLAPPSPRRAAKHRSSSSTRRRGSCGPAPAPAARGKSRW